MTLIATFLLFISILGWASLLLDTTDLSLTQAVFSVTAAIGSLMMVAFILYIPLLSARLFVYGGLASFGGYLLTSMRKIGFKATYSVYQPMILMMVIAIPIISLMAWGLHFSSIDDYSFWGTISRFLFVFNHLPENSDYINASFLQYTPGLASFHYLLYQSAGFYSPMLNYIGQDLILILPLLLFVNEKKVWQSLSTIMMVIITLYLAYGNILAKLEVDSTIAMWFFAMLWVASRSTRYSIWILLPGLMYLSVIKEIGLLFSLFVIAVHYACYRKETGQIKRVIVLVAVILCMKLAWFYHVHQLGFTSFSSKITFTKAVKALIPGNPEYTNSQILYIKGLLTSNFDHLLKIPFAALFILLGWQVHRLLKLGRLQTQHLVLFKGFCFLIPFYAINIYWLQAIVFRVGYQQPHLLDFPRYFNMAFVPFLLCVITTSLETKPVFDPKKMKSFATAMSIVALIFIVGGKIERTKKFYHPYDFNHIVKEIQSRTENQSQAASICISNLPRPDYQILMPLQYRLMPNHIVNYDNVKKTNCTQVFNFAALNR